MLENTFSNKNRFNRLYCKYRIKNYVNKTSEFLTRHKLLLAFAICLLVPGIHNLPKIGIPFFAIVDPTATIPLKLLCIGSILVFSLILTNAQANFITGGQLREYLNSFDISLDTHKKIDFLLLALSLNFIWLSIALGVVFIYTSSSNASMAFSLFCLYLSFMVNYLVLLLSNLYGNKKHILLLLCNLMVLVFISSSKIILINYVGAILISYFSLFLFWKTKPLGKANKSGQLTNKKQHPNSLKFYFTIQYAVYKQHKKLFLHKILYSTLINIFLIYLIVAQHFNLDNIGFFITIIGVNSYTLSTLFSVFQEEENHHQLFHVLFPYQNYFKYGKEIILTFVLFIITGLPFLLYLAVEKRTLFMVIFTAFLSSFMPLAINRALYKLSLRFCLFTSLINCMLWVMVQYWILGVIFEQ
ncbi:hypothetical protein [Legionella clemsonensis]|uniref:Uncharacterized protein n=1 Tax=Legionella clemsonensis TaxID=1867846 RepID=A0A222P5C1_9GAMM|nr:hypothetical protein [Legionella clemsonensis]ASQ47050.1 hypothetical protein clem_12575 [Legionella clemsonensis]